MTEPTPEDEIVDDEEETTRRNAVFNVENIPAPDFSLDIDPIETGDDKNRRSDSLLEQLAQDGLSTLAVSEAWYTLTISVVACICLLLCCLFLPDFPVLSNHILTHPGRLII